MKENLAPPGKAEAETNNVSPFVFGISYAALCSSRKLGAGSSESQIIDASALLFSLLQMPKMSLVVASVTGFINAPFANRNEPKAL
jgi:hypothetical protein